MKTRLTNWNKSFRSSVQTLTTFRNQEENHVKTVATVSSDLEKQTDAKLESVPWHMVVKTQVDESLQNMTKNIKEVESSLQQSRAEAAEQRDKEGHRNNIILYKVPETAPRADDQNKADNILLPSAIQ